MITGEAAAKIEEDLNYWRAFEHDSWTVSGFTERSSVIFRREDGEHKIEYMRLDHRQIGFLREALKKS